MAKSPGHQKWPEHKVIEERPDIRVKIFFNNEKIADSTDVIKVAEDEHPVRYYLPRKDVRMDVLERSQSTTTCPFKGTANYYTLRLGERKEDDAVWTYESPYDEHQALKERLAFYDDKVEIQITDESEQAASA